MKFTLLTLLPLAATAFTPSFPASAATSTALFSTVRPDASKAIKAALDASKKYGATSPEARVAWDIVEEMDASDNR